MACLIVGGSLLAAGMTPAWAQQKAVDLGQVTVNGKDMSAYAPKAVKVGTKVPMALRDIPQSVSVVTRAVIEDRNYTTLDELARGTPGLRVLSNDAGRSSVYSRGYEFQEYNINGLPAPMTSIYGSLPNLAAFQRVGILRGPSGLYHSTSALGGIVNLVLKQPTSEFQGHVIGRYGSWSRHFAALDVSGPLTRQGGVRGRLVAADSAMGGMPEGTDNDSQTFYGALDFDLGRDTLLSLALLHQSRDITPNNGVATDPDGRLLDYPDGAFFGAQWNHFDGDSNDLIAELNHAFENGAHGRIAARYSDRAANLNYIYAGTALQPDGTVGISGIGGRFEQTTLSVDASYSQPFEALGQTSQFVVGADYKHYKTDSLMSRARGIGHVQADQFRHYPYLDILGAYPSQDTHDELKAWGAYAKLIFRPVEGLALIGGARIGAFDVDYTNRNQHVTHSRDDSGTVTPYAGLVYDLSAHQSLYASYSKVFKAQSTVGADGRLLEPREGEQYEVGVKGSYFSGALNTRFTLFRMTDKHTGVPVRGENYAVPLGSRKVRGAEIEITGSPTPNWDVIFGYTFLDADVELGSRKNEAIFMLMPKRRANLWAQYHFRGGAWDGFRVGLGATAVSDFASIQGIHAPGYVVLDALVGYRFTERFAAKLNVNNLLGKDYYTRVGSKGTFNMRGDPANVMLSVRYDF